MAKIEEIKIKDPRDKRRRFVIFKIYPKDRKIEFFPPPDMRPGRSTSIESITLIDFDEVPTEFTKKSGKIKHGGLYFLDKKLTEKGFKKLIIENTLAKPEFKLDTLSISYSDFTDLINSLAQLDSDNQAKRREFVDSFFSSMLPKKYRLSAQRKTKKVKQKNLVMNNISPDIISALNRNRQNSYSVT